MIKEIHGSTTIIYQQVNFMILKLILKLHIIFMGVLKMMQLFLDHQRNLTITSRINGNIYGSMHGMEEMDA